MANRTLFDVSVASKVFGQKPTSSYRKLLGSLMNNLIEDPKTTAKVLGIKLKSQMNIKKFSIDDRKTMTISGHTNTMNLNVINRNIEKILDALITPSGEKFTIKNYTLKSVTDEEYSKVHESKTLAYILDKTGLRSGFREEFDAAMKKLPYMYSAKSSMVVTNYPTNEDELRQYFAEFGFTKLGDREYLLPMPEGYIRCKVLGYDYDMNSIYMEVYNTMGDGEVLGTIECELSQAIDSAILISGFYDNPILHVLNKIHSKIGRYWAPFIVDNRFYGYRSANGKKAFVIPTFKEIEFKVKFSDLFTMESLQNYPVAYYKNGKFKKFVDFEGFTEQVFESCKQSDDIVCVNEVINEPTMSEENGSDDYVPEITIPFSHSTADTIEDFIGDTLGILNYLTLFEGTLIHSIVTNEKFVQCKTKFGDSVTITPVNGRTVHAIIISDTFQMILSRNMDITEIFDIYIIRKGLGIFEYTSMTEWMEDVYRRYGSVCCPFLSDDGVGFYVTLTGQYYTLEYQDNDFVFRIYPTFDDKAPLILKPESVIEYLNAMGE